MGVAERGKRPSFLSCGWTILHCFYVLPFPSHSLFPTLAIMCNKPGLQIAGRYQFLFPPETRPQEELLATTPVAMRIIKMTDECENRMLATVGRHVDDWSEHYRKYDSSLKNSRYIYQMIQEPKNKFFVVPCSKIQCVVSFDGNLQTPVYLKQGILSFGYEINTLSTN